MKNIHNFFNEFRTNGGAMWADNGVLKMLVPAKFQNQSIKDYITENKPYILKILEENQISSKEIFLSKPILVDSEIKVYNLSPAQERLWFIEQYEQGTNAYHIPAAFELNNKTDVKGLIYALQKIVERHEVLRSTIQKGSGYDTLQTVHSWPFVMDEIHIDNDKFQDILTSDINKPFDLSKEYPIRAKLYKISNKNYLQIIRRILIINIHHIASDGWSMEIFGKELFDYYKAYLRSDYEFDLEPLKIQYKDYALWQRSYVDGENVIEQLAYWRNKLLGFRSLELPTDFDRPVNFDYKGAILDFKLSKSLSQQLRSLAKHIGITLNSIILSCFNLFLSKLTGQSDIIVGTPIANRHFYQTQELIGFFVNTQANRTRLYKTESFVDLALRIHEDQISAQLNQDVPFERIVNELKIERDTSRHPLFQVFFLFQNFGDVKTKDTVEDYQYLTPISLKEYYLIERFDISLSIDDTGSELLGLISYSTSLFREETIKKLIESFITLLTQVVKNPDTFYDDQKFDLFIKYAPDFRNIRDKGNISIHKNSFSEQQNRLFFSYTKKNDLHNFSSQNYYNLPLVLEIPEDVNTNKLNKVLTWLFDTYYLLKNNVVVNNKIFNWYISNHELPEINIEYVSEDSINEFLLKKITKPFDVEKDILIRFYLCKSENKLYFAIVTHQLLFDRKALAIFASNIFQNLNRPVEEFSLSNSTSYEDYVVWQNSSQADKINVSQSYWKNKLKNAPFTTLHSNKSRAHSHNYELRSIKATLTESDTSEILSISDKFNTTPYNFLLFAYTILISKLTGEEDIVLGIIHENRSHKELENVIGPLANLLPMRTFIDRNETVKSALKKITIEINESISHSNYSYERVVFDESKIKDSSDTKLFDCVFQYEEEYAIGGQVREIELNYGVNKYNINLLIKRGSTFKCYLAFNEQLYDSPRMERFLNHYLLLVKSILENTDKYLKNLQFISEVERYELLTKFSYDQTTFPHNETLISLFEKQVTKNPNNIALVDKFTTLSYAQLNSQANQLAIYLRERYNIRPGDIIGVKLDRGYEIIVTILGILKSGGAYVPIEPAYPQERVDFIIADCKCRVVLDFTEYSYFLKIASNLNDVNPALVNSSSDIAYVIYTSGSTGKPKGVMIGHRNVVRLYFNDNPLFNFSTKDVWSMFHSYCFDFSVWEMYGALLHGGKLVIVDEVTAKDPVQFIDLMVEHQVTILNQTPSSFYNVIRDELRRSIPRLGLRYVIFGGEALNPANLKEWQIRYPTTKLINMYGITETTVHVTYKEISEREIDEGISNIGTAIPTLRIYVLDKNLDLLPTGVIGELYVSGAGLARGYLNNYELTEASFIRNLFSSDQDRENGFDRLYKTGDLVQWLPDGNLEYIGRRDDQVKIRGFRIELGEIEHALAAVIGITQCRVLAKERITQSGLTKYLIGYYVSDKPDKTFSSEYITQELTRTLPSHMIPDALVRLESIPLTTNGKLDKRALPNEEFNIDQQYVAPSTNLELDICQAWQNILGVERIGMNDNFFRVGGSSILALQTSYRMSELMGCEVKVADIFKYKTPSQLLSGIDYHAAITIPKLNIHKSILSFAQERLWFIEQFEEGTNAYHIPALFEIQPNTNHEAIKLAIQKIVSRHEILRSTIEMGDDNKYYQVTHSSPLLIENNIFSSNSDRIKAINDSINSHFDLLTKYPIRVGFYKNLEVGSTDYLLINIHHIASDGWSVEIFQRELLAYYEAFVDGDTSFELPLADIEYKDYAIWQRSYLTNEILNQQLSYWRNKLSGYATLNLPTDYKRAERVDYNGNREHFKLSLEVSNKIRLLTKDLGVTTHNLLNSVFNILLGKYTGQDDIITGSGIANRHYRQTQNVIGFFVNMQVNRIILSDNQSFNDLVIQVHQEQEEAQKYQDLPFERLLDELNVERDPSRHPLCQVTFSVQSFGNKDEHAKKLSNYLTAIHESAIYNVGKFDLSVFIDDTSEELKGYVEYATSLFNKQTLIRFIAHFTYLVEKLLDNPNTPYSTISLLTDNEYEQIILKWSNTQKTYSKTKTIHRLFEDQVIQSLGSVALVFNEQTLTYQQLNEKSNQLARFIRCEYESRANKNITPDTPIALFMDRSIEMIVTILAVLKAGGAYVPIDISYPPERIEHIISDSGAILILTRHSLLPMSQEKKMESHKLILVDLCEEIYQTQQLTNLPEYSHSDDLAYVIYTSGTTGRPKGVMVEHRSVINLIFNEIEALEMKPLKRALQFASYVFDASVWEMFATLISNGQLFIVPEEIRRDAYQLVDYIDQNHINIATLPPALLSVMPYRVLTSLETLIVAGESTPIEVMKLWGDGRNLINAYGPTESTVCATMNQYKEGDLNTNIGKPLNNAQVYVVDKDLTPVPIGSVGELYIGGAVLARGYLNNEALTKKYFIQNPFVTDSENKQKETYLYKTGDLVRWLSNGDIEYVGRSDDQVKIRGHRIELAEIEQVLSNIDGIKQAYVTLKGNRNTNFANEYLAAFYVIDKQSHSNKDEVILDSWSKFYDSSYELGANVAKLESDFSGWNSFISGKPIPLNEMEAWRSDLINKIDRLNPSEVLEIGVGTGLLMYPLLTKVKYYTGIDISATVIDRHKMFLSNQSHVVELYTMDANQIENLPNDRTYDTIIINSVCQYFPGIKYFEEMLDKVLSKLTENGSIFLGDIRNYDLHKNLILDKIAFSGKEISPIEVDKIVQKENELLISPKYFLALHNYYKNIKVEILYREGEYENELSKYRYDVVISALNEKINKVHSIHKTNLPTQTLHNVPYLNQLTEIEIRTKISEILPEYMIPVVWTQLESFPLTLNGKVDKRALPDTEFNINDGQKAPTNTLETILVEIYAKILGVSSSRISINQNFFQMGGNSILSVQLKNQLAKLEPFKHVSIADIFKYDTIQKLIGSIQVEEQTVYKIQKNKHHKNHEIAIIGMSGSFSGAKDINELWNLIFNQKEGTRFYSKEECLGLKVDRDLLDNPKFISIAGMVDNIDLFDPSFWNMSPSEANLLNPQIRKFIEQCWFALESAGYINKRRESNIGVFVGSGESDYLHEHVMNGENGENTNRWEATIANSKDAIATKTAFALDLTGPAYSINTACSTGLVTVVEACKNLAFGTCDVALAGGSSLAMPYEVGYVHQEGMILSKDGHCRTFDKDASGSVRGSGVAVVLLKRLDEAIRDNDAILGVIKGYATNNDGGRKTGYTKPSVIGQSECIINAQVMAGITSEQIDYVECHGTGTNLGDPIEVQGLIEAFDFNKSIEFTREPRKVVLGAIKANIGHTDTAAGTVGLIKVCSMLKHNVIPAQINFDTYNPELKLIENKFEVLKEPRPWLSSVGRQRLAGVSSFGIGGTNAHIIVGEYISNKDDKVSETRLIQNDSYIIPFSAKSRQSLENYKYKLANYLDNIEVHEGEALLKDIAFTLEKNRESFQYRSALTIHNINELSDKLRSNDVSYSLANQATSKVVFMFPGQGAQYVNMARDLYTTEEKFRAIVDECIHIASKHLNANLKEIWLPVGAPLNDINNIQFSAISMFSLSYSLAKYLELIGVKADAFLGHSFGEYVAATLAGVFSLEDAIQLVVERGRVMQTMEKGGMLSINAKVDDVRAIIKNFNCDVAVINSIEDVVASGRLKDIELLYIELEILSIPAVRLKGSVAGHSFLMEQAAKLFRKAFNNVQLNKPTKIFISNVTGDVASSEVTNPEYWCDHLRYPVQFAKCIDTLCLTINQPVCFVELGPGKGLSYFIQKHKNYYQKSDINVLQLLPSLKEKIDPNTYLEPLCKNQILVKLWMAGLTKNLNEPVLLIGAKNYSNLPLYQFDYQKYWLDKNSKSIESIFHPIDNIFYKRSWERMPTVNKFSSISKSLGTTIVFIANNNFCETNTNSLVDLLKEMSDQFFCFTHIKSESTEKEFQINFNNPDIIRSALQNSDSNNVIDLIVYVSNTLDLDQPDLDILAIKNIAEWSTTPSNKIQKFISVSFDNFDVVGTERLNQMPSIAFGVTKSIPFEFFAANISATHLDLSLSDINFERGIKVALYQSPRNGAILASRGVYCWTPTYHQIEIEKQPQIQEGFSSTDNVFLITGGLGDIAYAYVLKILRYQENCKIVLIGRSNEFFLKGNQKERLEKLRSIGNNIVYLSLDLGDSDSLIKLKNSLQIHNISSIDLALHTAVVYAKSIINEKTEQDIQEVLKPKILGTDMLIKLAEYIPIKTLVNCSSLGSIFPSIGNMEYTAANFFLDEISFRSYSNIDNIITLNVNQISDSQITERLLNEQTSNNKKSLDSITSIEFAEILDHLLLAGVNGSLALSRYDINQQILSLDNNILSTDSIIASTAKVVILETKYTANQFTLAQIVGSILGLNEISLMDNFFMIGGNSILALKIVAQIKKAFMVDVSVKDIFSNVTIESLIHVVEEKIDVIKSTDNIVISEYSTDIHETVKLQMWRYLSYKEGNYTHINGIIKKNFDCVNKKALTQSIYALAERHENLRTLFFDIGEQVFQKVYPVDHFSSYIQFEDINHISSPEEYIDHVLSNMYKHLFDFQNELCFKCKLLTYGKKSVFVMVIDHMIYDAQSLQILESELTTIYHAYSRGLPNPLKPLVVHFRDYARLHNSHYEGKKLSEHQIYYDALFENAPIKPQLKSKYTMNQIKNSDGKGGTFVFNISQDLMNKIYLTAVANNVSYFNFMAAAYCVFMSKVSDSDEFIIDTPMSTRTSEDFSNIVGWVVGCLISRVKVDCEKTFNDLALLCKQGMIEGMDHVYYQDFKDHLKLGWFNHANQLNFLNDQVTASNVIEDFGSKHYEAPNLYFDLSFNVRVCRNGISLICQYRSDFIGQPDIEEFCQQFVNILTIAAQSPDSKIKTM